MRSSSLGPRERWVTSQLPGTVGLRPVVCTEWNFLFGLEMSQVDNA